MRFLASSLSLSALHPVHLVSGLAGGDVRFHIRSLSPAGAGVVSLAGGDLGLVGLHLGLAVPQQGRVHSDVGTGSSDTVGAVSQDLSLLSCYRGRSAARSTGWC